jgi:hypothetical protein
MKFSQFVAVAILLGACSGPAVDEQRPIPTAEQIQQAVVVHCDQEILPGFNSCAGDLNVYNGELVLFSYTQFTGCCMYTHPPAGTPWIPAGGLGTWLGTNGIRSWKSALAGSSQLCDGSWNCSPAGHSVNIGNVVPPNAKFNTDSSSFATRGMVLNN